MNPLHFFIHRKVATVLLTLGIVLAGVVAFFQLPVSPLPRVDYPVISVQAALPGASPETMAATVATPLERALGRIAGVNEITSSSSLGSTRVTLQFDLDKNIDIAAREVQAGLNAARASLPSALPNNPTYRKVNPSEAPVMILALTSKTLRRGQMYDIASTILAQKIAQINGVGQVTVGGGSLPAIRVDLNPRLLSQYGISPETVRTAISSTNVNRPKGALQTADHRWQIEANDQARTPADYIPIILNWQTNASIRLGDVATVTDGEQDTRNAGLVDGQPAVMLIINRQPDANVVATVDLIRAALPQLQAGLPAAVDLQVALDRTQTIRASLKEVARSLILAVCLVVLAVLIFLRNARATFIPLVAVPVSIVGTLTVMYFAGFSLNNLSLMALVVATGFVVDDAVVVLENIMRHVEDGVPPFAAALIGAREVGFTVVSMSISLIAVFIPILLMGGILGRLFREFAVTLSAAIFISMLVSLTTTPMLAARILSAPKNARVASTRKNFFTKLKIWGDRQWQRLERGYEHGLQWSLAHSGLVLIIFLLTVGLNVWLYTTIPKGFFPQQDTGALTGSINADQSTSFQAMRTKLSRFVSLVKADPAVQTVVGFTGGGQSNRAQMFISLKPLTLRKESADQVIARLRGKLAHEAGATLFLQAVQDIRMGGRSANAQYQYTLQADDLATLTTWEPRVRQALSRLPELTDVNTDQESRGQQSHLTIDKEAIARLGISQSQIDATLNDLFGQRQVSTIYNALNQYRVVMGAAPEYQQNTEQLNAVYLIGADGVQIPLTAVARWEDVNTPLSINHQGQFPAVTISFNLPPGVSLSQATDAIDTAMLKVGAPTSLHGSFQGTAKVFQASLSNQLILILAALAAVYIVLGVLYESLLHPLTILSTLPSAGVGALLALLATHTEFSVMAAIGVILLIGIVKKNAIMLVDFALAAQRQQQLSSQQAIYQACLLRLRPILMTTVAALFGALPLALGVGNGAELRQPLGIAIVGGLLLSQLLTLFTTPVVYLFLERAKHWLARKRQSLAFTAQSV